MVKYNVKRIHASSIDSIPYSKFDLAEDGSLIFLPPYGNPVVYYYPPEDALHQYHYYPERDSFIREITLSRNGRYLAAKTFNQKDKTEHLNLYLLNGKEIQFAYTIKPTYSDQFLDLRSVGSVEFSQDNGILSSLIFARSRNHKEHWFANSFNVNGGHYPGHNEVSIQLPDVSVIGYALPYEITPTSKPGRLIIKSRLPGHKHVEINCHHESLGIIPICSEDELNSVYLTESDGEIIHILQYKNKSFGIHTYQLREGHYALENKLDFGDDQIVYHHPRHISIVKDNEDFYIAYIKVISDRLADYYQIVIERLNESTHRSEVIFSTSIGGPYDFPRSIRRPLIKMKTVNKGQQIVLMIITGDYQSQGNHLTELLLLTRED